MGRQKLLMIMAEEELERLGCLYGDNSSERMTQYQAKRILDIVKACKVGNRYYLHNLNMVAGIFESIVNRINDDAISTATKALKTCNEYRSKVVKL